MVCYEISADGNLLVADPNYPGNTERIIKYTNGKFQPYNSGANADDIANGNGQAFENIQYFAKSTVLSWNQIAQHWGELKGGTIGDNQFPAYMLEYKNDQGNWVDLFDGLQTAYDSIAIKAISLANVNMGLEYSSMVKHPSLTLTVIMIFCLVATSWELRFWDRSMLPIRMVILLQNGNISISNMSMLLTMPLPPDPKI